MGRNATDFIHKEDHLEFQKNLELDRSTRPTVAANGT